ncbi:TonB-linked outer membrane protein, SusC/RagA family [Parapedobacter luteus]|uniref:TonB-linked outer membrane protein, SusC/RagA family n=1 Tax=Parapedobacter luteus TaxID=623280 RepID=A0A1T5D8V1_9SPHI|nr:TonB-dependent receptor [Parapedobacter luteus]SKB68046.1 TonB-linked outer membrane protein, SusC/RagA family [Parapedobacter luteus]
MKKQIYLLLGLLMSFLLPSKAQEQTISGTVTAFENGMPLVGVSVKVKQTGSGSSTDDAGRYQIAALDGQTLVFSYVGYATQEIPVAESTIIDVQLTSDNPLEEVVVVGYGTQRRAEITGSVATIRGEQISAQAVRSPLQALSGITPGVEVLQNSGQPGSALSVRVRGGNSILGGNEPLYVVDGFPISGSLEIINPNDIVSMEVLKDASATAIYGSRGANGVVMVTTKKGTATGTKIEYNGYYGWQSVYKTMDMLGARDFAILANERAANDGVAPFFTDEEIASFGEGTDWQDAIFDTSPMQNHSVLIAGGSERTKFSISGNYLDQQGVILNSFYEQMQLRNTIDHELFKGWNISLNTIVNRSKSNILKSDNTERGSGVLSGALIAPPTIGIYNEDGSYRNIRAYAFSPDIAENPVMTALERTDLTTRKSLLANGALTGNLTDDLVLRTSVGVEYQNNRADFYSPRMFQVSANGDATLSYGEVMNVVNENTMTYTKRFGNGHEIKALGGLTSQRTITQGVTAGATGFALDLLTNLNLQSGNDPKIPQSYRTEYSILSWLGRVNYSYQDKYLLTASIRADGSSRFGRENRWGYFPSVAGAWRISGEEFWGDLSTTINDFKLRASWGKTGSTSIDPYQSQAVLLGLPVVFDDNLTVGYGPGGIQPNPELKWETTGQFDVGIDLGFWNNRLSLVFDYYHKKTRDLLTSSPLPLSSGYVSVPRNVGSVENKGIDASINGAIVDNDRFKWNVGVNLSMNRNKVLELADGADIFGATLGLPVGLPVSLVREGHPVGVFYGYVENGLTADGAINFVDLDGNGVINASDRTIIGDPNPDYILGINSSLTYKNLTLSFLLNCVQGNDIFNYGFTNIADGFSFGINQIQDVMGNYWTADNPNPNAKYPKISSTTVYRASDRYVEDGSYIRMRNVQLAYTFKNLRLKALNLENSQVYLSAQNLFTITDYSFYTPEVNTVGGGISRGIDQYGYPDARTFLLGVRLRF